jgi:ribosomal protein L11 methyltransferase
VVGWLWEQGITGVVEEGPGTYLAYAGEPWRTGDVTALLEARLAAAFPGAGRGGVQAESFEVEEEDWSRTWKESWRPTPLGRKLLIVPAWWEEVDSGGRVVVRIDPGTAFGTGTHATTRLAWELVEEAAEREPPRRFLDVGTGSGLLTLGLLRLHRDVWATGTERDEPSISSLRTNLGLHPESARFAPVRSTSLPFQGGVFDSAVANLTELEQREVEEDLARVLAPGARLVLSGLLASQGEGIRARWEGRGFREEAVRTGEGWVALRMVGE